MDGPMHVPKAKELPKHYSECFFNMYAYCKLFVFLSSIGNVQLALWLHPDQWLNVVSLNPV